LVHMSHFWGIGIWSLWISSTNHGCLWTLTP
jgi:hypothetical protein